MTEKVHQVIPELSSWIRREIERVTRLAYRSTSEELGEEITSASSHRRNVHAKMAFFLENGLIFAQQFPLHDELIKETSHSFLMMFKDGICWVVDAQYLQFIPEDKRQNLPNVMFIPVIDRNLFGQTLLDRYSIANEFHHLWLEALS